MLGKTMLRRVPAVLILSLLVAATAAGADAPAPTTVFLVRHAEKIVGGADPELSAAGRDRAEELARVLGDVPIRAVYASQFVRTRRTGEPLARELSLEVTVAPIEGDVDAWAAGFAARLLKDHAGEAILVVGHSNTVPALMRALGATEAPELAERDYDDLFLVTRLGEVARVLRLHFGPGDPER
jgi:broad specificity phosphatase PhoE